jgi:hypothetical protein
MVFGWSRYPLPGERHFQKLYYYQVPFSKVEDLNEVKNCRPGVLVTIPDSHAVIKAGGALDGLRKIEELGFEATGEFKQAAVNVGLLVWRK